MKINIFSIFKFKFWIQNKENEKWIHHFLKANRPLAPEIGLYLPRTVNGKVYIFIFLCVLASKQANKMQLKQPKKKKPLTVHTHDVLLHNHKTFLSSLFSHNQTKLLPKFHQKVFVYIFKLEVKMHQILCGVGCMYLYICLMFFPLSPKSVNLPHCRNRF